MRIKNEKAYEEITNELKNSAATGVCEIPSLRNSKDLNFDGNFNNFDELASASEEDEIFEIGERVSDDV